MRNCTASDLSNGPSASLSLRTGTLAYNDTGEQVKLIKVGTWVDLGNLADSKDASALAYSPDGKILAATGGTAGQDIKCWNIETGDEMNDLTGHPNWVTTLDFSPDGRILASGSVDNSIRLWDMSTGRQFMVLNGHTDNQRGFLSGRPVAGVGFM